MFNYNQIKEKFKKLNMEVYEYKADLIDNIEETPFAVYAVIDIKPFYADGVVHSKFLTIQFEIVTDFYNADIISLVEQILSENDMAYSVEFEYDEELRTYSNIFVFVVKDE